MKTTFVLCVKNKNYEASLECFKVYRILGDNFAEQNNQLRVIDESGEGYLYPSEYFVEISLPEVAEKALEANSN